MAEEVISRQLGKDRALAQYVAEQVAKRTRGTYARRSRWPSFVTPRRGWVKGTPPHV